jgi:hypothetical protein
MLQLTSNNVKTETVEQSYLAQKIATAVQHNYHNPS